MLVIFALSITPKRFLHNIFAKHIDFASQKDNNKPYQLSTSGYNCDNDNLVAESNFVSESNSFQFSLTSSFSCYLLKNISYSSAPQVYFLLRGPPVNI